MESPVLLVAGARAASAAESIGPETCSIVKVRGGGDALAWVHAGKPDTIVLDLELPDMSGIVACRMLAEDPKVGHAIPLLLVSAGPPTPQQRVAALGAGAWDFIHYNDGALELSLKLRTYLAAKRNIDLALAEGTSGLPTRLFDRPMLARRARELGALMARKHGALACLVFAPEPPFDEEALGRAISLTARLSDVVGHWGTNTLALVAPDTDDDGAVRLARRVTNALDLLHDSAAGPQDAGRRITIGYDAVANLTYRAVDPLELLVHASQAVTSGIPDTLSPWVRRFAADPSSTDAASRATLSPSFVRTVR